MAKLTRHGSQRVQERIGATSNAAYRNVKHAFRDGITHKETFGALHCWMSGKYLSNRVATNMRIYRGYLYVFKSDVLITVYPLSGVFPSIEEYVEPEAYDRYLSSFKQDKDSKISNKNKRYMDLKMQFDRKVMLDDIREHVKGRYSVEIPGVGLDQSAVRVFYIPTDYEIPDLTGLVEYIKGHTHYKSVRLIHSTDDKGKRIYRKKHYTDIEDSELVYSI